MGESMSVVSGWVCEVVREGSQDTVPMMQEFHISIGGIIKQSKTRRNCWSRQDQTIDT